MIDHAARAEDIRWMTATGEHLTGAAERLGIKRDSLEEWCKDHGLRAELETLRLRDPGDPFNSARARAASAGRWAS